jgi:2',3'-cyclic-nucleotide 2'-phosphodiesterase/3'-nucleotidase
VATNTYRAAGGGHFAMCERAKTVGIDTAPVRDLIAEHVRTLTTPVAPAPRPHFFLTGFGAATLLYATGPGALEHPECYETLGLSSVGTGASGFHLFALAP